LKPGPKRNLLSSKSEWFGYAYKRLAEGGIKPTRGVAVTLAREILSQLPPNTYQLNTIEKITRLAVKEWKGKNPQISGK
jgi:hypothetical protein